MDLRLAMGVFSKGPTNSYLRKGTAAAREGHQREPAAPGPADRHRVRVDHRGYPRGPELPGRRRPAGRGRRLRPGGGRTFLGGRPGRQRHFRGPRLGQPAQQARRAGEGERGAQGQARQRRPDPQPARPARPDAEARRRGPVRHQGRPGHRHRVGAGLLLDHHHRRRCERRHQAGHDRPQRRRPGRPGHHGRPRHLDRAARQRPGLHRRHSFGGQRRTRLRLRAGRPSAARGTPQRQGGGEEGRPAGHLRLGVRQAVRAGRPGRRGLPCRPLRRRSDPHPVRHAVRRLHQAGRRRRGRPGPEEGPARRGAARQAQAGAHADGDRHRHSVGGRERERQRERRQLRFRRQVAERLVAELFTERLIAERPAAVGAESPCVSTGSCSPYRWSWSRW
ncbi:hypothetical protein SGPA1_30462 [Streptomyces misionensis JCM 4497]